jgi:hypothetical protein
MFVFNRSVTAVLAPLALLMAVVLWSSLTAGPEMAPAGAAQAKPVPQALQQEQVARVAPSRDGDS